MSNNTFTLEALKEELENEYAPLVFHANGEEFVLQSLLRVSRKTRDAVMEKLKTLQGDSDSEEVELSDLDEDLALEALGFILAAVTKGTVSKGRKLVSLLEDDLAAHMKMIQKWQKATQPGEASDSPS